MMASRWCDSGDAGHLARGYTGGGLTDWSLPSKGELHALWRYPGFQYAIGGFACVQYWSSSNGFKANRAHAMNFLNGFDGEYTKSDNFGVRPVRAF